MKHCEQCALQQRSPASVPLHPWEWPNRPWSRIHIDYAGPLVGKMFLVVIDAHSKWMDVLPVPSATTSNTISVLRTVFATHGLPDILVSDNGAVFTSGEFGVFLKRNGIRHLTLAPYHPATNGLAERAVQIFRRAMRKSSPGELTTQIARFLFHYRTTPHTTTGVSPAELLMGRSLRAHLDLMKPAVSTRVCSSQFSQKVAHDRSSRQREFSPLDKVYVHESGKDSPWILGIVESKPGGLTYEVRLDGDRIIRRHIDQIQSRIVDTTPATEDTLASVLPEIPCTTTPSNNHDRVVAVPPVR